MTCEDMCDKEMWKILYEIFLRYIDIAIFALGYFILPHPVYGYSLNVRMKRWLYRRLRHVHEL